MPNDYWIQKSVDVDGEVAASSHADLVSIDDLWNHAIGGGGVAAKPTDPPSWLRGPRPAGVEEAADWLMQALHDPGAPQRMFFLIGGPGGGKSHIASHIVAGLGRLDGQDDQLAHRTYRFATPSGRELLLVNDATIPSAATNGTSLAADLEQAGDAHLVACVNRGVLIDEQDHEADHPLGAAVTHWLRSKPGAFLADQSPLRRVGEDSDYLRQAEMTTPGRTVRLVAVFVDACSLLEPRPSTGAADGILYPEPYAITRFAPANDRLQTPAGEFMSRLVSRLDYQPRSAHDPVAANLASLATPETRNGVLSILRAAELNSAQRMSYRQLWGAAARAVAGHLPEQANLDELPAWLASRDPDKATTARGRFEAFQKLAAVRLHQALFDHAGSAETRHPVLSSTRGIDPAKDLRPGDGNPNETGWATPVFEAFAGAGMGASPLEGITRAAARPALDAYVTPFDRDLDHVFVTALDEVDDIAWRTAAIAWYGLYLSRMLAVATGHTAFGTEITAWTDAWRLAPTVPSALSDRLNVLIAPRRDPQDHESPSQVPLYASRAMALIGRPAEPTLVVKLPRTDLRTRKEGEDLFLEVLHNERKVGEILLDLPLVREAMVTGGGWLGLTDATDSTIPRLERFRAVNVLPRTRENGFVQLATQVRDYDVAIPEENR